MEPTKLEKLRLQETVLTRELRKIEKQNEIIKERRAYKIMEKMVQKKKFRRVPPPLVPLPFHLLPRKLIVDLNLNPPQTIITGHKDAKADKESQLMGG